MTQEPKTIFLAPEHRGDCTYAHDDRTWCESNEWITCPECGAKPEKYAFVEYVESEQ